METKSGFTLMDISEFENQINSLQISRTIKTIQNHHTYIPDYTHFNGNNHFDLLTGMRRHHVSNNGWRDIGQNITTFPDKKIAFCRNIEWAPACIYGNNNASICIEHIGNFDKNADKMSPEHKETIIRVNAVLLKRLGLKADTDHLIYHHWFDLSNGARLNGNGVTKSCPGTAFFGGNKVQDAEKHFIPLIKASLGHEIKPPVIKPVSHGYITASILNVRTGPGTNFNIVRKVSGGELVRVYEARPDKWLRISHKNKEWVYGNYVKEIYPARVTASLLNIRTGPGIEYRIIGSLIKNEKINIFKKLNGWVRIDTIDKYVSESFVEYE